MKKNAYILMGVCGCGKSTVGALIAKSTGGTFIDGDNFHPVKNVNKMSAGIPLSDEDRESWLVAIRESINSHPEPWPLFFGCSALKLKYRDILRNKTSTGNLCFIHLYGSRNLIGARMKTREGHFMKAGMLESQFNDLEKLNEDEAGFTVKIKKSPEEICEEIRIRIQNII